jgi:hypothetical protein
MEKAMSITMLDERLSKYQGISENKLNESKCVYEFDPPKKGLDRLALNVEKYLKKICEVENLDESVHYEALLLSNCKTPNGILKPKLETIKEYQAFCIEFFSLLTNTLPTKLITLCALPSIRIKSNIESSEIKNRPFYTGNLHSDAWVGHTCDAILLLHLFGSATNTVEFFEPTKFTSNLLDVSSSFSEGIQRVHELNKIGQLAPRKLVVMDHACLHRTYISEKSSARISLDMGVYMVNYPQLTKECPIHYYSFEDLLGLGKSLQLTTDDSIFDNHYSGVSIRELN